MTDQQLVQLAGMGIYTHMAYVQILAKARQMAAELKDSRKKMELLQGVIDAREASDLKETR